MTATSWVFAAPTAALDAGPVHVEVAGTSVVLCWLDGEVVAMDDRCVHRGTRLSLGWVDGACLVCPYHGWQFAADGACRQVPALGGRRVPERARVASFEVSVRDDQIWVALP